MIKPYIGMDFHLVEDLTSSGEILSCQAAKVTGKIVAYQAQPEDDIVWGFHCVIFPVNGPKDTSSRYGLVLPDTKWHEIKDCPNG